MSMTVTPDFFDLITCYCQKIEASNGYRLNVILVKVKCKPTCVQLPKGRWSQQKHYLASYDQEETFDRTAMNIT